MQVQCSSLRLGVGEKNCAKPCHSPPIITLHECSLWVYLPAWLDCNCSFASCRSDVRLFCPSMTFARMLGENLVQSDGRVNAIQDTEELRYWATGTRSLEQGRVNDCAVVRQQIASGREVLLFTEPSLRGQRGIAQRLQAAVSWGGFSAVG